MFAALERVKRKRKNTEMGKRKKGTFDWTRRPECSEIDDWPMILGHEQFCVWRGNRPAQKTQFDYDCTIKQITFMMFMGQFDPGEAKVSAGLDEMKSEIVWPRHVNDVK